MEPVLASLALADAALSAGACLAAAACGLRITARILRRPGLYANAGVAGGIDVASLEHHVADNGGAPLAVDALNGVGRERALELWLSMEGVIEDLCE